MTNGWKKAAILFGILVPITGVAVGYGALQQKAKDTDKKVEKIEVKVEINEKDIDIEENINIKQSIILERTVKIVDNIERRMR